jgi:hypothetical protein
MENACFSRVCVIIWKMRAVLVCVNEHRLMCCKLLYDDISEFAVRLGARDIADRVKAVDVGFLLHRHEILHQSRVGDVARLCINKDGPVA